jgi:DNA-binding XRE family transcriptional regulator
MNKLPKGEEGNSFCLKYLMCASFSAGSIYCKYSGLHSTTWILPFSDIFWAIEKKLLLLYHLKL